MRPRILSCAIRRPGVGPDQPEKIDLFGRFTIAFDLMEGKGAGMGVQPVGICGNRARFERAKAFAKFAVFDATLHGEQRLRRMFAQRACECDLLFGGMPRGLDAGAPNFSINCPASRSIIASLSASVASVTMASVDHPKLSIPRKPERSATRCFCPNAAGSRFQNTNAPETAHSPGSAARSKTNVFRRVQPDGSRKLQHVRLIRISDRAPAHHTKWRVQAHPQDYPARALPWRPAG